MTQQNPFIAENIKKGLINISSYLINANLLRTIEIMDSKDCTETGCEFGIYLQFDADNIEMFTDQDAVNFLGKYNEFIKT